MRRLEKSDAVAIEESSQQLAVEPKQEQLESAIVPFFFPAFLLFYASFWLAVGAFCFESLMNGAGYLQSCRIVSNPDGLQESHGGVMDKAKTERI